MDTATSTLRAEHRRILAVVDVLETELNRARGGAPDFDTVDDCITFFRLFADACHHAKEEDLLFPELQQSGMPRETGPIAVMLEEHRLGRAFVRGMADALPDARAGEIHARDVLERNARDYIALIRAHIGKEDHVLFNMADRMVGGTACGRLCSAYAHADTGRFEQCTKAQLEALAERLTAGN